MTDDDARAAPTSVGTDRLPEPGAGFVWTAGEVPVIRPLADGVVAAFTTRRGGVSRGAYRSLNLSTSVGDDHDAVRTNRRRAAEAVGREGDWCRVRQVHGADVVRAEPGNRPDADAVWTDEPALTLAVNVADCVPVLLVAPGRMAAVHAGWRGLVSGVVARASEVVEASAAWAGPAIGPCCFEVGGDVVEAFGRRFGAEVVADERHVDLWRATELAALRAGVADVRSARVCTSCHSDLFFSHRRDRGRTGRQALVAALEAR